MSRPWIILMSAALVSPVAQDVWLSTAFAQSEQAPAEPSPLAVEPSSNLDRLETVTLMANLGRYDLAKRYLQQLLEQNLSDEDVLALRDEVGTVELFRLSRIPELRPESQRLLDQVNAASKRNASDPARIDRILGDLDQTPRQRELALLELKNIGVGAVPRLLQHLGGPESDQDRDRLVYILTQMGRQILPAMIGAMETDELMLKTGVIEVIGLIGDSSAVDSLWSPAYSEESPPAVQTAARVALARILYGSAVKTKELTAHGVTAKLTKTAKEYFERERPFETDESGRVTVWKWDKSEKTVRAISVTPEAAGNAAAIHYSRQALGMVGEDVEIQALNLAALLADAGYRAGWTQPLPTGPGTAFNLALTAGTPVLNRTVELSLAAGRIRAAESAVTALALTGDQNLVRSGTARSSALMKALNAPDRRVQFAAAVAILQLEPQQSFTSSQRIVDILIQAVNDPGKQSVLVIDPNIDRGRSIATAVGEMGYAQEVAATGKEGFQTAATRGDVSLVMLHLNCVQWELSQTIANLRADSRTSGLPIVIYGPTYYEDDTLITIQRTPRSKYVVYSDQRADIARQLRPFMESQISPPLSSEQRDRQSTAAMSWLARMAESRNRIFDLQPATEVLFMAINTPQLAEDALIVLSVIPTAQAQMYLAESVLSVTNSAEVRVQAALRLGKHIQKFGVLLDQEMVGLLKQLWETEENLDVQTALTAVVGTFQPSPALVEKRLKEFVAPEFPAEN